jgi:hypothetical protein
MKYILIDQTTTDMFNDEFDNLETALNAAETQFNYLTENDKKKRTAFYLLESINPDEDAPDHFDGNIIKEWL